MCSRPSKWSRFGLYTVLSAVMFLGQRAFVSAQDTAGEIKTLLKERRAMLEDVVKNMWAQYEIGTIHINELLLAQKEWFKADQDLAENPKERLVTLRAMQKQAENLVKVVENRQKVEVAKAYEVLQAKAHLLAIRVEILREEQKMVLGEPKKAAK
jgi:outer membrane protein TolC